MKKFYCVLLLICTVLSASGCADLLPAQTPRETVFPIDAYHLQITADSSFKSVEVSNFDLQITNGSVYLSVMGYHYIDLPTDSAPIDYYNFHNEDMFSRRQNVAVIEEAKTESSAERTLIRTLYSAEKDGVKNYYASYLVDFPEAGVFAWVLVTSTPSYMQNNSAALHEIVCSLTPAA